MADFNGCSKCLELSKNEQVWKNKIIKKVRLVNLYRKYCQTYDIKKVKETSRDVSKNLETAVSDANILRSRLNHFISENTELLKIKEENSHQISQLEKQCRQAVDKSTHLSFINEQLVAYHTSQEEYFQKLKSHVKRLATHVLKNDPKNEEAKTCLKLAKEDRPSIRSALKKGKRDINSDDLISTVHKDSKEEKELSEKESNLESVPADAEKEPSQNISQQSIISDLESNCSPVSKVLSESEYYSDEDIDSIPLKKTCVEACPDAENKIEEILNTCNSIQEIQSPSINKDNSCEILSSEHFDFDGSHPDSVLKLLNSQSDKLPPEELFCSGNKDFSLFDFSSIDSNLQDISFCKSFEEMSSNFVNGNTYKDNAETAYFLPPLVENLHEENTLTLENQMPCEESLDILERSPSKPIELNDGHNDLSIPEDRIANTSRVADVGKSTVNTSYHHLNPDRDVISDNNSLKVFGNSHEQNSKESFTTFEKSPSESIKLNDTSNDLSIPKDNIANNSWVSDIGKSHLDPVPGVTSDSNNSKVFMNSYEQNSETTDTSHMLCDKSDTLAKRPSKSIKLNERSSVLNIPGERIANTPGRSTVNTSGHHLNPIPGVISSSNSSNNNNSHEQEKNEPDIHELDCGAMRKNPPNSSSLKSVISTKLQDNACTNDCLVNNDVFEENITIEEDKHENVMDTEFNPNQQQDPVDNITGKNNSDEIKNETSAQNANGGLYSNKDKLKEQNPDVFGRHSPRENVPFGNNVFTPRYQLPPQDFIYACCSSKDHLYTDRATFFWNFKDNTSVQISVPIQRGNDKIGIKINDADSGMDCYSAETSGSKMTSKYSIIVDMNPDKVTSDLNCHCSINSRTDRKSSVKSNDCRSSNSLRDGKEKTSFRNVLIGNVHENWHKWRNTQETTRFLGSNAHVTENGFSLEKGFRSSLYCPIFPRRFTKLDVEGLRHAFESISLECSASIDISDPVHNESDSNPIFSITKKPLFYNPLNVSNSEVSRTFGENTEELVISQNTVATLKTKSFVYEQQKQCQFYKTIDLASLNRNKMNINADKAKGIVSYPKSRNEITKGAESSKPDNLALNESSEKLLSTRTKSLPSEKGAFQQSHDESEMCGFKRTCFSSGATNFQSFNFSLPLERSSSGSELNQRFHVHPKHIQYTKVVPSVKTNNSFEKVTSYKTSSNSLKPSDASSKANVPSTDETCNIYKLSEKYRTIQKDKTLLPGSDLKNSPLKKTSNSQIRSDELEACSSEGINQDSIVTHSRLSLFEPLQKCSSDSDPQKHLYIHTEHTHSEKTIPSLKTKDSVEKLSSNKTFNNLQPSDTSLEDSNILKETCKPLRNNWSTGKEKTLLHGPLIENPPQKTSISSDYDDLVHTPHTSNLNRSEKNSAQVNCPVVQDSHSQIKNMNNKIVKTSFPNELFDIPVDKDESNRNTFGEEFSLTPEESSALPLKNDNSTYSNNINNSLTDFPSRFNKQSLVEKRKSLTESNTNKEGSTANDDGHNTNSTSMPASDRVTIPSRKEVKSPILKDCQEKSKILPLSKSPKKKSTSVCTKNPNPKPLPENCSTSTTLSRDFVDKDISVNDKSLKKDTDGSKRVARNHDKVSLKNSFKVPKEEVKKRRLQGFEKEKELQLKEELLEHIFNTYKHVEPLSPFGSPDPDLLDTDSVKDKKDIKDITNKTSNCILKSLSDANTLSDDAEHSTNSITIDKQNLDECEELNKEDKKLPDLHDVYQREIIQKTTNQGKSTIDIEDETSLLLADNTKKQIKITLEEKHVAGNAEDCVNSETVISQKSCTLKPISDNDATSCCNTSDNGHSVDGENNWREESMLMEFTPENNAKDKFIAGIVNQSEECTSKFIAESSFNSSRGETENKNDDNCSTSECLVKLKEVDTQGGKMATTSYSPTDISFKSDDNEKGKNTVESGKINLLKDKGDDKPECKDSHRVNKNNLDLGEQNKSISEKGNSLLLDSVHKSSDISNDSSITVSLINSPVNLINRTQTRTSTKISTPFKETENIKHTTNDVNDNIKSLRNQKTNETVKGVKHCLPGMLFDVVEKELTLQPMNSYKDKASLLERSPTYATDQNKVSSAKKPENKEIIPIKEKGVKIIKSSKAKNKQDNANIESKRTLKRKKCLIFTDEDTDAISDSEPLSSTIKECLETSHSSEGCDNKKASPTKREENNKILSEINDHYTKNTLQGNNCLITSDDNDIGNISDSEPLSPAIKDSLETSLSSEEHDNKNASPSSTEKNNKLLREINEHNNKNTVKRNDCFINSDKNIDTISDSEPPSPAIKESLEASHSSEEHDNKNASSLKTEKNNKIVITLRERNSHKNKHFLRRKNCLISSDDENTDAISDSEPLSPAIKESLEASHSSEEHDNKIASPSKTENNNKILREINYHNTKNALKRNNCFINSDDNNIDAISDSEPLSAAIKESLEASHFSEEHDNKNTSPLKTEKNNKIVITLKERNGHNNKHFLRRKNCLISSDDEDTDVNSDTGPLSTVIKESLETNHSSEKHDNKSTSPSKTEKNNKNVITLRERNGYNAKRFLKRKKCLINSDDEGTDAISDLEPQSVAINKSLGPIHSSEEYDNKKASPLIRREKNNEIVKTQSDKNDHNTKTLKTKNILNVKNCLGNSDDSEPPSPVIKERLGTSFSEEYDNRMKDNKIVTILSEENQNTNNLESQNTCEKKYLIFSDDGDLDEYLEPSVTKESPEISDSDKVKVDLIEDNSLKTFENFKKYQLKQRILAIEKELSVQELDKCKSNETKIDNSADSKLKNDFSKRDNTTSVIHCKSAKLPDEKDFNKRNVIEKVRPQFYVDSQLPNKSCTLKAEETNHINPKDIKSDNLSENLPNFMYNKSAVKRCASPAFRGFYADTSETISPSETSSLSINCKKEEKPYERKMKLVTEEKDVNALMSKPNNTDDPGTSVFQVSNTLNSINPNKRKNVELSDSSELLNKKLKLSETGVNEPEPLDLIECKQNFFICALNYCSSEVLSKGWREDKKPVVNKQTVSDIKFEVKRLIGAAEGNLYKHLNKVVEPFIKSRIIEPRPFAKAIIELICEDKRDKLEEYPHIARIAKLCIMFSISFIGSNEDFLMETLRVLEEHLCAYHDRTLTVADGVNLVAYYTALCKHYGLDMKGKQMIYDILYARHNKAYPMVYNILKIWPALLPKAFKCFAEDCLLTQTIVFILLGANGVCGENFLKLFHLNNLNYFIRNFYGYGDLKRRDELCEQIIKRISEKGSRMALILLAHCEGFEWAVTVVEKKLFPLLHAWLQNNLDRITAEEVIWTIGMVVRAFPLTKSSYFVKATLDLLEVILHQSPDELFSETVIGAVSLLRRHNLMLCALILIKWIPKNKTVTKKTIEHARNILSVKNITHWKSFFSKQHTYTETESLPS